MRLVWTSILASLILLGMGMSSPTWAKPDLQVTGIQLNPPTPAAAKPFKISVTVKNAGKDRAGSRFSTCSFEIYAYVAGKKVGSECDAFGLAGNSSSTYTINVPASGVPTSGTKTLRIVADATKKVSESNESNNESQISVTFTLQGSDLVVNKIWTYPTVPLTQNSTTLYAQIQNNGSTDVSNKFKVKFTVDGKTVGEATVSSLSAGSPQTVQVKTTQTTTGSKTVKVTVDSENKVTELKETNNDKSASFVWKQKLPDLIVESITVSPTKPVVGASTTITAKLKNIGTDSAGGITNAPRVQFLVDGKEVGVERMSFGLGAGSTDTESVSVKVSLKGPHKIKVVVDHVKAIKEINENNNEKEITVSWLAAEPDFNVFDLTVNPGSPIVGSPATFTASIKNVGTVANSKTVDVDFYLSGKKLGTKTFSSVGAGKVTFVSYSYTLTTAAGPYKVKVEVNAKKSPSELSYTNNTREKTFTWGKVPYPDLVVTTVSTLPVDPVTGQKTQLTCVVRNQGSKRVGVGAPSFRVRFYVDGKQVGEKSQFTGLSAGSATTFNLDVTVPTPGPHKIKVEVDPDDKVVESDEKNNSTETSVIWKAPPRPDFSVETISTLPITVTVNKSHFLVAKVTNKGQLTYNQPVFVRFWVENNKLTPDFELKQGVSLQQLLYPSINYTPTKSGTLLVKAMIDPDNKIAESDEKNNSLEFKMTVAAPDADNDKDGVPASKDCDDNDKNIYPAHNGKPAAKEVCNNKDDNCDGKVDEDFDKDGDGVSTCAATPDCKDDDKTVFPGAAETCNNKDDNCDGQVDNGLVRECKTLCGVGTETCQLGQWAACTAAKAEKETCNGKDDDCNGVVDDGSLCTGKQQCKAGVCVDPPGCTPECKADETCVNSQCVPNDPCANVQCKAEEECKEGKCVAKPKEESTPVEVPATEPPPSTPDEPFVETPQNGQDAPEPQDASSGQDASTSPDGPTQGGCGCQSTGVSSSWLWLLVIFGFLAIRRRN